jgi:hypothetical protein
MDTARWAEGTSLATPAPGRPDSAGALPMPGRDDYSGSAPCPGRAHDLGTGIATEFTTMIDQVFAAGVTLESAANLAEGLATARLQRALDELDAVVRDTRTTAFWQLTPPSGPSTP